LTEQQSKLKEEVETLKLSIPEQRELLLAKVKAENLEIVAAEKCFSELKEEIQRYKKQAAEMETDINVTKGTDQHKYEILFSKDEEMTQFEEGFEEAKNEEETQMRDKQLRIVQLLAETSKMISREKNMPAQAAVREMEDELDFKGKQLQNSEVTAVRLRTEQDRRLGELDKINSLDNKINSELKQLGAKQDQFKNDMSNKYDHVDKAKEDGERMLRQLIERREAMSEKVKAMKPQVMPGSCSSIA
jgi:intraflagellar transport protein 74